MEGYCQKNVEYEIEGLSILAYCREKWEKNYAATCRQNRA